MTLLSKKKVKDVLQISHQKADFGIDKSVTERELIFSGIVISCHIIIGREEESIIKAHYWVELAVSIEPLTHSQYLSDICKSDVLSFPSCTSSYF